MKITAEKLMRWRAPDYLLAWFYEQECDDAKTLIERLLNLSPPTLIERLLQRLRHPSSPPLYLSDRQRIYAAVCLLEDCLSYRNMVLFMLYATSKELLLYAEVYPLDRRPHEALEAAVNLLQSPSDTAAAILSNALSRCRPAYNMTSDNCDAARVIESRLSALAKEFNTKATWAAYKEAEKTHRNARNLYSAIGRVLENANAALSIYKKPDNLVSTSCFHDMYCFDEYHMEIINYGLTLLEKMENENNG